MILLITTSSLYPPPAAAQSNHGSVPIVEGQILSRTQTAGQSIRYAFDAQRGQIYLIEVVQNGLDFIVSVESVDGSARTYDSPLRRDESELVVLQAKSGGTVHIQIESRDLTEAEGTHTVQVHADDEWAARDSRHVAAWRLMSEGAAANAAGDKNSAEVARSLYAAAAPLWEALGDKGKHAQALYSIGMLEYWQLESWDSSINFANRAAELYRELGATALYANAIFLRAYARIETANAENKATVFRTALTTFDEALGIHEELGNDFEKAHILNFIGIAYWYRADGALGDFDSARSNYKQSIDLFSRIGEWREELNGLQNIVVLDYAEGKRLQAISSFDRILSRLPPGRDPALRATILGNLGTVHLAFGNVDKSLRAHSDAHAIYVSIEDSTGQGYALKNIGQTYFAFGDFDSARRYLEQAKVLAEDSNDERTQANVLSILGNVAFAEQEYQTALEGHRQAVALSSSSEERARRKLLLARDLAALDRHDETINEAQAVHAESRSEVTRADALHQLALSHIARGETSRGVEFLDEASRIYERLKLSAREGDVLHAYSLAAEANDDLTAAAVYGRAALDQIDTLRERVAHPELRALSSATRRGYYEHQIDLLMELHNASGRDESEYLLEALTTSERSRARMTMDLLSEAAVDLDRGMDLKLAEERRALYEALAEKRQQQERASSTAEFQRLSSSMDEIENQILLLETEHRRNDPKYVGFASTHTLNAAQIQAQVDSDSLLLQYALGDRRSFLWAVTSESIRGFVLADRAAIEQTARSVYADLRLPPGSRKSRQLKKRMSELSDQVLSPVHELLDEKARLLIAADGALQYIPFAVLPAGSQHPESTDTPLVAVRDDTEIVSVASMSVREALASSSVPRATQDSIAIFADPVMQATDRRLPQSASRIPVASVVVGELTMHSGAGPSLSRIPYTGAEAAAIADLAPDADRLLALGFAASLNAVTNEDLRAYRYIHFATHGIVDAEHPALSALALSQFDEQGRRQPGYLRMHDIYSLELNADVVVLSACETGLGREIRGEGLIGLTQGFIYAGARSLVASLWQVPDRGTSALMMRFYGGLLNADLSPPHALAEAQRSMAATRGRSDPFFWGAFVIQGDWW